MSRTPEQVDTEIDALKAWAKGGVYVEPSQPATPTPTPPPPTPTPTPQPEPPTPTPTPGGLYASIGGIPSGLSVLDAGRDLSKLAGPALLDPSRSYKISGGLSQNLYAAEPGKLLVPLSSRQQVQVAKDVTLAGFGTTGGGLAKSTNAKDAAVLTTDGVRLCDFEVTKAVGVGIRMAGTGLLSSRLHAHHNGTSGRMIFSRGVNNLRGSGYHEVDAFLHDNNKGGLKSDAANKATQTSEFLSEGLRIWDEWDGAQWFDISCWHCILVNVDIRRIVNGNSGSQWYHKVGVRFELQCHGLYPSGIYGGHIDALGSVVAINESSNIEVNNLEVGPCTNTVELRQQTRNDDPGDGGLVGPWPRGAKNRQGPGRPGGAKLAWEVYGISLSNLNLLPGAGPLAPSGSGNDPKGIAPFTKDIRLGRSVVTVDNCRGLSVKIPA